MSLVTSRLDTLRLPHRLGLPGVVRAVIAALRRLDPRRLRLIMIFSTIFAFDFTRPTDVDLWWHIKTGELIARTGSVPSFDSFSYTAVGRPWVAHEWLWELGLYEVNLVGGYRLAVLISAIVVTLTCAVLYRLLRHIGTNELVSASIVVWVAVLAIPSIGVRPREFTFLFLALFLSQLALYRSGRVRTLWSLPVIMALWVNVHGLFILGLVVIGMFGLGAVATWLFERGKPPRHLALIGVATTAVTLISPQGPKMLLYPLGYFFPSDNPSFSTVSEFRSPDFHDPLNLLFAAGLLMFMVLGLSRSRAGVFELLSLGMFATLGLISQRNVPVFALVAAPILAAQFHDRFKWARELRPLRPTPSALALNWLLLAGLIALGGWYARTPAGLQRLQLGSEPKAAGLPVAGARLIEQQDLRGPIFSDQAWGGYLIYRWYPNPERRVFMDGRVDMYGTSIAKEYTEVVEVRPGWKGILDKYAIQTLLIDQDSALSTLLLADGGWDRVFHGDVEDVFVRRK